MKELVEYKTAKGPVKLSPTMIRNYLVSGKREYVTPVEIRVFLNLCFYQKLNPWLREAYLIKYKKDQPATIIVGKDVFLKRATHNPKYRGHDAKEIVDRKGNVLGAWAEVYIDGYKKPIRVEVDFKEYVQYRYNEKGEKEPNRFWREKPKTMIRKVALAQALREAFPEDFGGLYTAEEMPVDVELSEEPVEEPEENEPEKIEPEKASDEQLLQIRQLTESLGKKYRESMFKNLNPQGADKVIEQLEAEVRRKEGQ